METVRQIWDSVRKAVFVVGGGLIIFASARNTITWHLQKFWGASGDYWQRNWEYIYDYYDGDQFSLAFTGTAIVSMIAFWLFNLPFLIVDITGHPSAILQYKIQENKNVPVDRRLLLKAVFWVMVNQVLVAGAVVYLLYRLMAWRDCCVSRELPTFHWVMLELVIFSLIEEVLFYYSHRLLHHRLIYRHIHKMHHEWVSPISLTSIYAHPLEHLVSNMLPSVMGPVLMSSHVATVWLWYVLALLSTTIAHSGYHLPFLPSPEAHDFHHLKFVNNFGVLGVLDRLHGTDNMFRQSKHYQRHILLLSLTPVKTLFPDDDKQRKDA